MENKSGTIPRPALIVMMLLAAGLPLWLLTGDGRAFAGALLTAMTEASMAALIVVAAGGLAYPLVKRLAGRSTPRGLVIVTACGLGLWGLSTAVLVVGSSTTGLLTAWLWWPVIAIGVLLAAWQGRRVMEGWHVPLRFDGQALTWVVLAGAVGIWLAGATNMPGLLATADAYDVLEYHLQVPREFFAAQHIGQLQHNCYSYYPMSTEMLFLLAMCLRNGAYQGVYLAKLLHGAFAVLAIAAVFTTLSRRDEARGRFASILLGTMPLVLYLSWLAMVELSMVFYTMLAVLWLRQWLADARTGSAVCIGLAIGAACAAKYLSLGLVAGPVLVAMVLMAPLTGRLATRLSHVVLAGIFCGILFSPWLIRNAATTGDPMFPLATTVFGRGHWSAESQQRWLAGHGPQFKPPVPAPPDWSGAQNPTRLELFYDHFMTSDQLSPLMLLLAGVAVCMVIASARQAKAWDASLAIILVAQIAVWAAFSHDMPTRFLAPAVVPICLLAAGTLAGLAVVKHNPFKPRRTNPDSAPWGRPAAVAILATVVAINLVTAWGTCRLHRAFFNGQPVATRSMAPFLHNDPDMRFPLDARYMLIGDSRGWYWPVNSIYATAFDSQPLAEMIQQGDSPQEVLAKLRRMSVTYLAINWSEAWRLTTTYGYASPISRELYRRWLDRRQPGLAILDQLETLGARKIVVRGPSNKKGQPGKEILFSAGAAWHDRSMDLAWPAMVFYAMPWAPTATQPATAPASESSTAPTGGMASGTGTAPTSSSETRPPATQPATGPASGPVPNFSPRR